MYISYIGTKYLSLQLNYKRIEKSNEQTHIEFIQNLTKKFSFIRKSWYNFHPKKKEFCNFKHKNISVFIFCPFYINPMQPRIRKDFGQIKVKFSNEKKISDSRSTAD